MKINIKLIKQEMVNFLRNQDIFSIATRGVSTKTDTGTFAGASTYTLSTSPTTAKNVRSVTRGSLLTYGEDYTVNFLTGVITFTVAQTGSYTIIYDYGTDKIYPDYPRDDLTISSYPRIAVDILSAPIDAFGIGGDAFISNVALTIVVYDKNSDSLDGYVQTIKDLYVANSKNFYYLNFVKPILIGPTINSQDKKDEIMQKNIDILGMFSIDTA